MAGVCCVGLLMAAAWWCWGPQSVVGKGIAILVLGCSGAGLALRIWQCRRPEHAFHHDQLWVNLGAGAPLSVPVEMVKSFFFGSIPLGKSTAEDGPKTMTLVLRLASEAGEWAQREVSPKLGRWSDGYIIFHGAWCEPLTYDLLESLNARLTIAQHLWAEKTGQSLPQSSCHEESCGTHAAGTAHEICSPEVMAACPLSACLPPLPTGQPRCPSSAISAPATKPHDPTAD